MSKMKRIIIICLICITSIWIAIYRDLPSYQRDKIFSVPQSSVIVDREGNELFRFFDENRRRIQYPDISSDLINAIVVTEDKSFRTNDGVDTKAILRAITNNIKTPSHIQGASTITQQLVKNVFLSNKQTLKRKIQEAILAKKLTNSEYAYMKNTYPHLGSRDVKRKAKESIISMYLNVVFFGNQSYGIQSASHNYFHLSAGNLSLLQSVILASLPQAPSLYNPVLDTKKVLGYRNISSGDVQETYEVMDNKVQNIYKDIGTLQIGTTGCLASIEKRGTIHSGDELIQYNHGRKDDILCKLYSQGYINTGQFQQALMEMQSIYIFQAKTPIHAPHFVFRVKKQVKKLPPFRKIGLTENQLVRGGFTIKTTLDPAKQEYAQQAVDNYMTLLKRNGGNNRALIHVDSTNGDVLSYIGSQNFFDDKIEGQNDIIQSIKQVGSTLKPFFYAYLFAHYDRNIHNQIGDLPIPHGPSNHDNKFRGKISIADALAGSRNLPVVRLFIALGSDSTFIPFLKKLGFQHLQNNHQYNYPLALGAGEQTMRELANAYTQLSATGDQHYDINPILSITNAQGKKIYNKYQDQQSTKKIIPDSVSQMIRDILSDQNYLPQARRPRRMISLQNFALKTGTSDKKQNGTTLPRDGWMVIYTPQDVIITRAGNTDGHAMGPKAYGGDMNYYVMKQYIHDLVSHQMIEDIPRATSTPLPQRKKLNKKQIYMLRGR